MRDARQVFWGIVTAVISIALLLGGFSLSLIEGNMRLQTPTLLNPTLPPTITLTRQPSPSLVDSPPPLPRIWTPTLPPPPTNCPPPSGWLPYIVQPGDSLDGLALRFKKTSAEISQANCLVTSGLLPGLMVYLPPLPTQTPVPCGAPRTWVIYIVQQGDTLYHLGQVYGIPFTDIQRANCLRSFIIHVGQPLYVPPWATRTPSPTLLLFYDTPSATWTDTPTGTASTETSTPTDTTIPIPTDTVPTSDGY
jgi:LysM repeat protein